MPAEVRAPEKLLFRLKKQLVAWGFERRSVRVDVEGISKHLKVEGKIVVTVSCVDGSLVFDWIDTWRVWSDLHDSVEFKKLVTECKSLVAGKGKGKGKTY